MSFVNPLFLLGALAVAIPILLHLIKRESAQKIEFPTLMFLRRISKRTIRYQKLRHLLLLLVRVLALLLLALAFMRPFWDRPQAAAAPGQVTTAHVILLDNSMSMAYGDRWERARKVAVDIAEQAKPGDKVSLLEFSDQTHVLTIPATDFSAVVDQINSGTELTDRSTRYSQALRIAEKSALDAGTGRHVIHLISDFQKSGWATDDRDFRLGSGTDLQCTDVGSDQYSNLALGDVQVLEGDEEKGGGLKIRFSVVNFGAEDRNLTRVTLAVDGRTVAEKRVDVAKGAVQGTEFDLPGLTAGMHNVALEVDDPAADGRQSLRHDFAGPHQDTGPVGRESCRRKGRPSTELFPCQRPEYLCPVSISPVCGHSPAIGIDGHGAGRSAHLEQCFRRRRCRAKEIAKLRQGRGRTHHRAGRFLSGY